MPAPWPPWPARPGSWRREARARAFVPLTLALLLGVGGGFPGLLLRGLVVFHVEEVAGLPRRVLGADGVFETELRLPEGAATVAVEAVDEVGNRSELRRSVTIDLSAPAVRTTG